LKEVARVALPGRGEDFLELAEIAASQEGSAEDWSTSVRMLCKACHERAAVLLNACRLLVEDPRHLAQ